MVKKTISGLELTLTNPEEILEFGGPYVSDLYVGKQLISKDCIASNFVYKHDSKMIFFVKYHRINSYHYFTINFFNILDNSVFEFSREFDMVYIKEFISLDELKIYHAFHDKTESTKLLFNLNSEDFKLIR